MLEFFSKLFDTSDFSPRWYCGHWTEPHGWLHIVADVCIFGAYLAIPCVLAFFLLRRKDIPFPRVLWLFVAFIFACGFGHLLEAVIFWRPIYRFAGLVKLTTAVVSWGTVFALVQIVPKVLHLPGLSRLNADLQGEVDERKKIEQALRQSEEKLAALLASERSARGEAERANRIKDEFLSTVSHELRTPLNAILGYAQLLQHRKGQSPETEEGLSVIERNAKAQAQIIEDLLDMSRIIAGKVRLDVRPIDPVSVIEVALESVRPAAEAKQIRLQSTLDPQAKPVLGDPDRLQQVTWNLLTNAIKFTPRGGQVQVSLQRVNSHMELSVSDTGKGIAAAFLPHVFDRFTQAEQGTARRHGGLGLGLSIVRQLVELHGGSVEAESAGEGQGASFTVRLPLKVTRDETADGRSGQDAPRPAPAISLVGISVLVIDDDPDARELVRRLLNERGATTVAASSAREGLAEFQKRGFDVVLSDLGMPEQDGFDFIAMIRKLPDEQGGNVPAAALTALTRSEDRTRAMLAGYQAHIAKPVDSAELFAMVATLAGRTGRT